MYQSYNQPSSFLMNTSPGVGAPPQQQQMTHNVVSASSPIDDEFDVDREQPREEQKFEMINSSHHTLTTVQEEPGFMDTLGALNRDNNLLSSQQNAPTGFARNPEFSSTSKTAEQMATLQ